MVSEKLEVKVFDSKHLIRDEVIRYGGYAFDLYLDFIGRTTLPQEERDKMWDSLDSLYLHQRFQVGKYIQGDNVKSYLGAKIDGIDNYAAAYYFWKNFIEHGSGRRASERRYMAVRNSRRNYSSSVKWERYFGAVYNKFSVGIKLLTSMYEQKTPQPKANQLRNQMKVIQGGKK